VRPSRKVQQIRSFVRLVRLVSCRVCSVWKPFWKRALDLGSPEHVRGPRERPREAGLKASSKPENLPTKHYPLLRPA
jgi:hypothetical protein